MHAWDLLTAKAISSASAQQRGLVSICQRCCVLHQPADVPTHCLPPVHCVVPLFVCLLPPVHRVPPTRLMLLEQKFNLPAASTPHFTTACSLFHVGLCLTLLSAFIAARLMLLKRKLNLPFSRCKSTHGTLLVSSCCVFSPARRIHCRQADAAGAEV
jgi:hypothetical protein